MAPRFGWAGPIEAQYAWDRLHNEFVDYPRGMPTEVKRTCAWDAWETVGFNIETSPLAAQEIGDCVGVSAGACVAAVAAYEIARLGEPERFEEPFAPFHYGCGRLAPEAGNGRIRGADGSLGSWQAIAVRKYGILRASYQGVPEYSGRVAARWGTSWQQLEPYLDEGDNHLIKSTARITSVDELADALSNGYFCTIASMRGFSMGLRDYKGKSWFTGRSRWPHQMTFLAVDTEPELCFFRGNQWRRAHGNQLDGPDIGGWISADDMDGELRSNDVECYAYSMFEGFPDDEHKPRNYFA